MRERWETVDHVNVPISQWPSLSVIVPARNEADSLPVTLPSWLDQNYPDSEIIVIDDESHDHTAECALEIAGRFDGKIRIVSGTTPPPGWTGKLWALQQGIKTSSGEWLLFTDADISHRPNLWRGLVAKALTEKRSMVSLMVLLDTKGVWPRLLIPAFVYFFHVMYPFEKVRDRRSPVSAAAGGCILIERKALDKIGGIEGHRDAWIDDLALAKRVKQAELPIALSLTKSAVSIRSYRQLAEVWNMVARNAFVQLRCSWFLLCLTVLGMAILFLVPVGGICAWITGTGSPAVLSLSCVAHVLMVITYIPTLRFFGLSMVRGIAFPLAGILYAAMTVSSAINYLSGRREWRGARVKK
ncbi:MAG: glycosyl transferase family 2 [Candidatus Scalindua sp.]|nr:MAG: glycosyl transferase family 2 [Candidatus Scalindua sp.]